MKLSAIVEDDKNMVMVPLVWLSREDRQYFIQMEYEVIPIAGYQETEGYRACKIIGKYVNELYWIRYFSIPIWEDFKLTAKYANSLEYSKTTTGRQMFDHLDDDEKIQALKYHWWDLNTISYIKKYFKDYPELFDRARHSLKREEINKKFKDLFIK